MSNFKDFTRAIAGIASALKGINTVVDSIPVPGESGGSYDITETEVDTGLKYESAVVYAKRVHFASWSGNMNTSQSSKDIGVAVNHIISLFVEAERATDSAGQTQKVSFPVCAYFDRREQPTDTTINYTGLYNDSSISGKPYDLIIYYTKQPSE